MIAVSICICTFRRPQGLRRLLDSLARLDPATPPHEIIVADNDAARSGEAIVAEARAAGLAVQYRVEPRRGIAAARNCSLRPARGEFVAFIDDDEEAEPRWLLELYGEVVRHGADGGVGPVLPRFPPGTPRWMIDGGFYERPRHPTGTLLGTRQTRTGNALLRRRLLPGPPGPFDERLDLTGGEDTQLLGGLIAAGARMIAVDSAIVHEHLSANRTTVRYLLWRRFNIGLGGARFYVATTPREAQESFQRARALAAGLAHATGGLLLLPASRTSGVTRLAAAARCFGRFAFHSGFTFRPYGYDWWR